jgi:hypothetical protein
MDYFDFTFDCPVYLLRSDKGLPLLGEHAIPVWTDMDAAETFVERNHERCPYLGRLALVEIETDDDLLALLTEVQQAGIVEVAFDLTSADQTIVRMLYTADVLDLLQERIAEAHL